MLGEPGACELFYDAGCGPCTFFARASRGLSRVPIAVRPLDSPDADRALAGLTTSERFGAFHLVVRSREYAGAAAVPPLLEVAFGPAAGRVARGAPPLSWLLRRTYLWFWNYRRTRGCAAVAPA